MRFIHRRIGLRTKTLLGTVIPLAALFVLLTMANERYLTMKITGNYRENAENAVKSFVSVVDRRHARPDLLKESQQLIEGLRRSNPLYREVVLFIPAGHSLSILAKSQTEPGEVRSSRFLEARLRAQAGASREIGEQLEIAAPIRFKDKSVGILSIKVDLSQRDRLLNSLRTRAITLIGISLVLLSGVILFGINHTFVAPLRELRLAAALVEQGRLEVPPHWERRDELGDLANTLEEMTGRLSKHSTALEQRVGELTLLYNISKVTNSSVSLGQALETMLESAVKVTGATSGFIMIKERADTGGRVNLKTKVSLGIPGGKAGKGLISEEVAKFVAKHGGPLLLVGDITRLGFQRQKEFKDAIYAPISFAEETIGVIGLTNKQNSSFDKKDLQLLITLANQASGVINNARLYEDLQDSYFSTIQALAAAIDAKDPYTRGHSSRVVRYSQMIAAGMGYSESKIKSIKIAAYLHDVGKIGIDENILLKPMHLTAKEYEIIKRHSVLSAKILARVSFLQDTIPIVRHHHERFDGSGYPDGLAGMDIPQGARILAVADSYDAMTSDRPYRQALSHQKALEELKKCAGAQFDPEVVETFIAKTASTGIEGGPPVPIFI